MQAWSGTCRVLVLAWLVAVLAAMQAATALAGGRYALIIGNGNYDNAQKLPNAVKDATDLAASLERLGFIVDLGTDLNLREFKLRISDFRATVKAAKASEAVFYYAGHGFALRGLNHLVPVDAELNDKDQIPYETMQLGDIVDTIQGSDGQQTVIFLDACRDNPLPAKLRDKSEGLAKFEPQTDGIYLAFATAPGQVTRDGKGKNSPFAAALLKYIEEPGQSVSSLMIKVRNDVKKATKSAQVPWSSTDTLSADFIFNIGEQRQVASAEPPPPQPTADAAKQTDEQDCPFYGCGDAVGAASDTTVPQKTDPPVTVPLAGGAVVPTESAVDTVQGTIMDGQPLEGLSTSVSDPPPSVTWTPSNGAAGEDTIAPAATSDEASPAANKTQITLLTPDDVTRSAPAIESEAEVASPVKGGTVLDSSDPAPSNDTGTDFGTPVEGQVLMAPDAAPAADALPAAEGQANQAPITKEPATADPGISKGTVIEGQVVLAPAETVPGGTSVGKVIDGQDALATAGTVPSEAGAGKVIEGQTLPAAVAANTAAEPVVEAGGAAIPSASNGAVIDGQVLEIDPAPAVVPDTTGGSGLTEQGNTVVASLPAQAMDVQAELARVGCFTGKPDGNWGRESRDALGEYFRKKNMAADLLEPTDSLLSDLKAEPGEVICVAENVQAPAKKERVKPTRQKPAAVKVRQPSKPAIVRVKQPPKPPVAKAQPSKPKPSAPPKKKPDIFIGN